MIKLYFGILVCVFASILMWIVAFKIMEIIF
jgi:hypothetical protein